MLTFKSGNGKEINIGGSPFKLLDFDFGNVGTSMQIQKGALQDGSFYISNFLNERDLSITFVIVSDSKEQKIHFRRMVENIFNPKNGQGKLTYTQGNDKRSISVVVDGSPVFVNGNESKGYSYQKVSVSLTAHNPYWTTDTEIKQEIAIWKGAFEFELQIDNEQGNELGYREPSLIVNCFNDGDVECGMRIVFKANGTLKNPSLFNVNTREFIKVNTTMVAGDVITVTTYFGKKRIELYKNGVTSNVLNYIDLDSTFLQLKTGDNLFRYDATENLDALEIDIYYMPQYMGV